MSIQQNTFCGGSGCSLTFLPTEIWSLVATHLSHPDLVSLLWVSRMCHDIAVRNLFTCTRIFFIGQSFAEVFGTYPYFVPDMDKAVRRLLKQSWEKLEYIVDNPSFAVCVKTLSVIAFADSPSIFEQMTLAKALRAMSNLKTFYWFGIQPGLPSEVADCLPTHLKSLHVQSALSLSETSLRHFQSMKKLRQLQLETLFHIPPRMHSEEPDISFWIDHLQVPDNTIPVLESLLSPNLRCLSLLSGYMDGISMLGFGLLTELDLYVTGSQSSADAELRGLDLVFRHMPMLESLSIVGLVPGEIFNLLPNDPTILPRLKSFRLSTRVWALVSVTETHLLLLSQFLGHKPSLRRLSLCLGGSSWNTIISILPTIAQLHSLEVFGLHAGALPMTSEDFVALASILTPKMTSIQLVIPWDYPDTSNVDVTVLGPLLQRLKELSHLRFIHFYSIGRVLPIAPEDLVTELVHLRTLAHNRSLWDVNAGVLSPWKPWRVRYAIDEDFDYLDDAWLFKHI